LSLTTYIESLPKGDNISAEDKKLLEETKEPLVEPVVKEPVKEVPSE
jgi:hypothetical protein